MDDTKVGIGKMTTKGQVTIPGEIRKKLKFKPGDQFLFVANEKEEVYMRRIDGNRALEAFQEFADTIQEEMEERGLTEEDVMSDIEERNQTTRQKFLQEVEAVKKGSDRS